jgi:hypothetical protein
VRHTFPQFKSMDCVGDVSRDTRRHVAFVASIINTCGAVLTIQY